MMLANLGLAALLLAPDDAQAHLPHQQVFAVAVPADMDPTLPWFLTVSPSGSDILLRSDDGGWMWQIVGGDPTMDSLNHGAYMPDGTVVLSGQDGLWFSEDQGETWDYAATPDPPTDIAVLGDSLFVGTTLGLYSGTPDDLSTVELEDVEVASLHVDQDAIMVVGKDGGLQRKTLTSGWSRLPTPGDGALAAAWDSANSLIYAADRAGLVYRLDEGDWTACGSLPAMENPAIYQMAVSSGVLLAAPGDVAPYASDDLCETWEDRVGMVALYEVEGGVAAPPDAFTSLEAKGADWYMSGWDGWIRSDDAGATWAAGFLIPVDYTRGLNFSPDFENDGRVYIGGYAAGVIVGIEGGRDYIATGYGLYRYNSQKAYAAPDNTDVVYAIIGHSPWRSVDGGISWVRIQEGYVPTLDYLVESADEAWLVGTPIEGVTSGLAHTTNGGKTWDYIDSLNDEIQESIASHVMKAVGSDDTEYTFVLAQKPVRVIRSTDDGDSWELVYEAESMDVEVTEGVAWPPDAPDSLLMGVGGEMMRSSDWGETWEVVETVTPNAFLALAIADDGTMLGGHKNGDMLRSTDGGDSWDLLSERLPSAARAVSMRPNFAEHPVALIGTHDGIYALEDLEGDSPTMRRWGAWQIVDEASQPMVCETCESGEAESIDYAGAARDQVIRVEPEMVLKTVVRGNHVRVLGAIDGGGNVTVEVGSPRLPGDAVNIGGDPTGGIVELVNFDLEDDWHEVEIRGVTGDGIVIDAVEGISDQPPLDYAGYTGDGGAADGGAADGGAADGGAADGGAADGGAADGGAADGGAADGGAADGGADTGGGKDGCGGCAAGQASPSMVLLPLLLLLLGRRRED